MGGITEEQFAAATESTTSVEQPQSTEQPVTAPDGQPVSPKPEGKDKFGPRFAALAKREAKLRELDAQHKQRATELETRAKEIDTIKQLLSDDPIEALKKMGCSYDDLTRRFLGSKATPEELAAETERKAVEKAVEAARKIQEEQAQQFQQQELNRRVASFKTEASTISKDGFPLLSSYSDAEIGDAALQMAQQLYNATGEVLTVRQAVEHLESQLQQTYDRLSAAKQKVAGSSKPAVQGQDSRANRTASPTLTNAQAADVGAQKTLSREERRKRIANGELG